MALTSFANVDVGFHWPDGLPCTDYSTIIIVIPLPSFPVLKSCSGLCLILERS